MERRIEKASDYFKVLLTGMTFGFAVGLIVGGSIVFVILSLIYFQS